MATYPDFQNPVDDELGGYLITEEVADEIFTLIREVSVIDVLARPIPMKKKTKRFRGMVGGLEAYHVENPGDAKTVDQATFGKLTLTAEELAVINVFDEEEIEDADMDVANLITEDTVKAFAEKIDEWAFTGTGAPATWDALATGITAGHTIPYNTEANLALDVSEAMNTVEVDLKMSVTGFAAHPRIKGQLRKLTDSNDRPLYQEIRQGGEQDTLWGLPIKYTTKIGTSGESPDTTSLFVGRWDYALAGNRKRVTIDVSKEATVVTGEKTYRAFQQDLYLVRYTMRKGFKVRDFDAFAVVTGIPMA